MATEELLQWCRDHGVSWHGIESGFVSEGWRGVIATQDLEPDTCVLRVPQPLLLTAHSARRDPTLRAVLDREGAKLTSNQVLAIHLLHEVSKGEGSFWWPYLRSLPRTYTTAMCFRPADIEELQVPYAQQAVEEAVEAALTQLRGALPALRALCLAPKWLSKQAWLWAASTISSRTMYVPFDPAGALTPFGDLHNYAPPPPPYTPRLSVLSGAKQLSAQRLTKCHSGSPAGEAHPPLASAHSLEPVAVQQAAVRVHQPRLGFQRQSLSVQESAAHAEPARSTGAAAAESSEGGGGAGELEGSAAGGTGAAANVVQGTGSCCHAQPSLALAADSACPKGCPNPASKNRDSPAGLNAACPGSPTAGQCGGGSGSNGAHRSSDQRQPGKATRREAEAVAEAPKESCSAANDSVSGTISSSGRGANGAAEGGASEGGEGRGRPQNSSVRARGEQQQQEEEQLCGDGSLEEAAGQYCIYVRRRYRMGEQVMLCYGRHTNLELLAHYGFALPSNQHDTALLPAHLLPLEVTTHLPGLEGEEGGCYLHADGSPSWALLRALRLAGATSAERKEKAYLALQKDAPISVSSEARALRMLRDACHAALCLLPSTAQEDEALLEGRGRTLGECERLAVDWRLGYKRILLRCKALCDEAAQSLAQAC